MPSAYVRTRFYFEPDHTVKKEHDFVSIFTGVVTNKVRAVHTAPACTSCCLFAHHYTAEARCPRHMLLDPAIAHVAHVARLMAGECHP